MPSSRDRSAGFFTYLGHTALVIHQDAFFRDEKSEYPHIPISYSEINGNLTSG